MANMTDYPDATSTTTLTFTNTLTNAIDLHGTRLVAILFPATMTGTAITIQASMDGTTFDDVYDAEGTAVGASVVDGFVSIDPLLLLAYQWIKIESDADDDGEEIQIVTRAT